MALLLTFVIVTLMLHPAQLAEHLLLTELHCKHLVELVVVHLAHLLVEPERLLGVASAAVTVERVAMAAVVLLDILVMAAQLIFPPMVLLVLVAVVVVVGAVVCLRPLRVAGEVAAA